MPFIKGKLFSYSAMKQVFLRPNQIIGMMDYPPLHSPEALAGYYKRFERGEVVQPVPLIPVSIAIPYFTRCAERFSTYREQLERFIAEHPEAEYFMLGGKHRATAATVVGKNIPCIVIKDDDGVHELLEMKKQGQLSGMLGVGDNLEETLAILEDHFFRHKQFWTMEEKTEAMIVNGDVPEYMLK